MKQVESWLEETLTRAFKLRGTGSSLCQLGIDRNHLQAAGLQKQNQDQLYRSLYVFSSGTHDILDHYKCFSPDLPPKLWDVMTKLLEHCEEENTTMYQNTLRREYQDRVDTVIQMQGSLMQKMKDDIEGLSEKVSRR
jgi:hypothetical protein